MLGTSSSWFRGSISSMTVTVLLCSSNMLLHRKNATLILLGPAEKRSDKHALLNQTHTSFLRFGPRILRLVAASAFPHMQSVAWGNACAAARISATCANEPAPCWSNCISYEAIRWVPVFAARCPNGWCLVTPLACMRRRYRRRQCVGTKAP